MRARSPFPRRAPRRALIVRATSNITAKGISVLLLLMKQCGTWGLVWSTRGTVGVYYVRAYGSV